MKVKKEIEFIKTKINWIQIQMLHKQIPYIETKNQKINEFIYNKIYRYKNKKMLVSNKHRNTRMR